MTPPRGTPASRSDFRWATSLVANTRSHAPSSVAWAIAADSWGGPPGAMGSPPAERAPPSGAAGSLHPGPPRLEGERFVGIAPDVRRVGLQHEHAADSREGQRVRVPGDVANPAEHRAFAAGGDIEHAQPT